MAQVRSNGCLLIFIGFCLGWGFAQLSRPADTTTTATPAPAASMASQSQVQSAPAPVAVTDPSPAPVSPEPQTVSTAVDLEREAARAAAPTDTANTGELRTTLSSAAETALSAPETTAASPPPPEPSDARIRRLMIQDSIANYYGSCPCPYNTDRAGRACGGRSAYSRPGGASPLCYPGDVSDEDVAAYRRSH